MSGCADYEEEGQSVQKSFLICNVLFLIFEVPVYAYIFLIAFRSDFFWLLFLPVPLASIGIGYYWPRYQTWRIGAEGEEKVADFLESLEGCYTYHDVTLPGESTNIDHVVLAPNGVFVIETKNNKGAIRCDGDYWELEKVGRRGTPYAGHIGSPSKQVKRNAVMLRKFISTFGIDLFINGVVCFPNPECVLKISEPTVGVMKLEELGSFILQSRKGRLSALQIRQIGSELEKYASSPED